MLEMLEALRKVSPIPDDAVLVMDAVDAEEDAVATPVATPVGTPVNGPELTCTAASKVNPEFVTIQCVVDPNNKSSYKVITPKGMLVFDERQKAVQAFYANVNHLEGSCFIPVKMNGIDVLKPNVPDAVNRVGLATPQNVYDLSGLLQNPPLHLVAGELCDNDKPCELRAP